jgi:membrane protease YdiL (CAAX protease family)
MSASAPAEQPGATGTTRPAAATRVQRWPLLAFFAVAFGASLLALAVIGLPSIHASVGSQPASLVMFPVMVTTVGIAGVALSAVVGGRAAARELLRGVRHWRVPPAYYLAPIIPPVCILAVLFLLRALVDPAFAPNLFPIGLAFGLIAGFLEELGWSGFAYPRLRVHVGAFRGAVVLGLLWGLWHLPIVDALVRLCRLRLGADLAPRPDRVDLHQHRQPAAGAVHARQLDRIPGRVGCCARDRRPGGTVVRGLRRAARCGRRCPLLATPAPAAEAAD